jgi:hypothetical protein
MTVPAPYRASGSHPRFLWGDSILDYPWNDFLEKPENFEPIEFIAHTRNPRFLYRVVDDRFLHGFPADERIWVQREEEEERTVWRTNFGFYATDFVFFDSVPENAAMENVLRDVCVDRKIRDSFFGMIE